MTRQMGPLLRFACVGVTVAGAYVLAYLALLSFGLSQPLANLMAFGLAVLIQYVGQATFTFGRKLRDSRQVLRFALMILLGLVTSAFMTGLLGPRLGLSAAVSAILVTLILPIQNYLFMSLWVFAKGPVQKESLS